MMIIEKITSDFGKLFVLKSLITGAYAYWQGGCCQSESDDNGTSLAPYVHAMFGLICQTTANSILMIGCGGGTLGTMLSKAGRRVTIVDVNPASILVAQKYFSLSPDITCHVGDGLEFIRNTKEKYDIIILDAFEKDQIPEHLCSPEFFGFCRTKLTNSGYMLVNIVIEHDFDFAADEIATRLAETQLRVRVLDTPGRVGRNAVIIAGTVMNLLPPPLIAMPQMLREELQNELSCMRFRVWRSEIPDRRKAALSDGARGARRCYRSSDRQ